MSEFLPDPPQIGALVRVRSRQYLVENRLEPPRPGEATIVRMPRLDDDAQGEPLEVLWEHEIDAEVVAVAWDQLGRCDFDPPHLFAAYLHALCWNCVTATTPRLSDLLEVLNPERFEVHWVSDLVVFVGKNEAGTPTIRGDEWQRRRVRVFDHLY